MDTKGRNDLTEEELVQVRRAMDAFGNAPLTPVVKAETAEEPVKVEEQPVKKRKKWVVWIAVAVAVALVIGIGYGYWAGLSQYHPNSMANRYQTVDVGSAAIVVLNDGTVDIVGTSAQINTSDWDEVLSVGFGNRHVVGLRQDGTVVFSGDSACGGECKQWTNMRAVSAGGTHTVGLRKDGTVVAAGRNTYGQCDVSEWKNMIGIAAGEYFTAGLRFDGTVEVTGIYDITSNLPSESTQIEKTNAILRELRVALEAVRQWEDVITISVGDTSILGLKEDGTVVAAGINDNGQCDVQDWTDMVWVDAGFHISVGIRSDGTVLAAGGEHALYMPDPDAPDTSPQTLCEAIEAFAAEYAVVAIWSHTGFNLHFLCEDGKLYRVSHLVINDKSVFRVHEVLTDVRLP